MVVDTSALLAILFQEAEAERVIRAVLEAAPAFGRNAARGRPLPEQVT